VIPTVELAPGYRIPRLIVGAWQLSRGHRRNPKADAELLDDFTRIADAGLTTFDCADIYTGVEEFLGEFRGHYARVRGEEAAAGIRVHTKLVPDLDDLATFRRRDAERIVDRSLERLGVGRLDLVQLGWWSYDVERWVDVARWLDELREAGKVRLVGATNFDAPSLGAILDAGIDLAAHQVQYSVLDSRPGGAMTALCRERGVALLCYGTLAGGFLSDRWLGRTDPEPPLPNRSLVKYRLIIEEFGGWDAFQGLLETLREIGDAHDASIAQVAIAYTLAQPAVAGVIVGASRRPGRMREAAGAAVVDLSEAEIRRIRSLADAAPGPAGPVFGLERDREGPHGRIMKYDLHSGGGS